MERIEHKCVRYALFALQPEEALNFAKQQKIPVLEIIMRAFYGIALITGGIILKVSYIPTVAIIHKVSDVLFVALLVILFVHKNFVKKA